MRGPLLLAAGWAALAVSGCASLSAALTPSRIHTDATLAYIALANWISGDEAHPGLTPARIAADEARKLKGWNALTVERAIWTSSGPHPATALDTLADSLKPAGL